MIRFFSFISAISILLAGFTFDSDVAEALPIPYPLQSLGLGIIAAFLFFLSSEFKVTINRKVATVGILYLLIFMIGLISSILSGAGDILALGMKAATLFLNFVFLLFGAKLYGSKFSFSFASCFLFVGFILALAIPYILGDGVNNNWVGITLTFSFLIYAIFLDEKVGPVKIFCGLAIISLYALFVLGARGVFFACALSAMYIVLVWFIPSRVEKSINRTVFLVMPTVGLCISAFGVWLYRSPYYSDLTSWSRDISGKSLDSSRLERWDMGFELLQERPLMGWGVDAHLARAASISEYGDLHNLWWEYLFRFGVIGTGLLFFIFVYVSRILYISHRSKVDVVSYFVVLVFLSVYALGGVTHWPGSYMFWLVLGALLSRAGRQLV